MAGKHTRGGGALEILLWLVVVVAIVILAATLSFRSARTHCPVPAPSCQRNLKLCALALQMYCSDYDAYLPSSLLVSGSKKWNSADFVRFASISGDHPAKGRPTTWSQVLYNNMKERDQMFCPADPARGFDPNGRVSYYWRAAMDKAWYGIGCKSPCRKLSDFKYQQDQIALYERAGFHCGFPQGLKNGVMINAVSLDAHVRMYALRNCAPGVITDPASLGEPMCFNFDNTKPAGPNNPPPANVPATHTDPTRYSDRF